MKIKRIETQGLTKSYPGILALDRVDFDLFAGEVHILFGENGAGKSTLISMLAGVHSPTDGKILVEGNPVEFESVKDAQNYGIFTVFQEFSLIPTMTVAENLFLGNEPKKGLFIDRRKMNEKAHQVLLDLGFDIDSKAQVSALARAQQQMVEIAKALMGKARVLILDEPTASLTDREVTRLFEFIQTLKSQGVGIIYISHRMQEFEKIGDRITVLRDGQKIGTLPVHQMDEKKLMEMMAGREISEVYPQISRNSGETILKVENLQTASVHHADFEVRKGEILGIAGLIGSGKSRIWRAIMGLEPKLDGRVYFCGKPIHDLPTRKIIDAGIYYLSPDRKHEGLDLVKSARENLAIDLIMDDASGSLSLVNRPGVKENSGKISDRVELSSEYRDKSVSMLSGGNQQKVLFGKCFAHETELYIFDEPSVGVDMGTRAALYRLIGSLAESGKAIVIISSDLPEVMHLSHRLMVFCHGNITAVLDQSEINEERVLRHFFEETETIES